MMAAPVGEEAESCRTFVSPKDPPVWMVGRCRYLGLSMTGGVSQRMGDGTRTWWDWPYKIHMITKD